MKRSIYQLKITLKGIAPPIWRSFMVQSDILLLDLHKIIQTVMGWTNSHLHHFIFDNKFYSEPNEYDELGTIDYSRIKLNEMLKNEKDTIIYEYDFGDSWEHNIKLENILPASENKARPICINGKRRCPPEDCGGTYGYMDLIEIINNQLHEEYEETMEWLGGEFDPKYFNVDSINIRLEMEDYGCITFRI